MMELRARSKSRVLDDLVEKLRTLPRNHPDRPHLIRMIIHLSRETVRPRVKRTWDSPSSRSALRMYDSVGVCPIIDV